LPDRVVHLDRFFEGAEFDGVEDGDEAFVMNHGGIMRNTDNGGLDEVTFSV